MRYFSDFCGVLSGFLEVLELCLHFLVNPKIEEGPRCGSYLQSSDDDNNDDDNDNDDDDDNDHNNDNVDDDDNDHGDG